MMKRLLMVTLLITLASNLCMAQQPAYEFPLSGSQSIACGGDNRRAVPIWCPSRPCWDNPFAPKREARCSWGFAGTRNMDVFWGGCRYGWCSVARAQGR